MNRRKRVLWPVADSTAPHLQARRAVIALLKHIEKERAGSAALFADADIFSLVRRFLLPSPWSMLAAPRNAAR